METPTVLPHTEYYFLKGGGELGELTRSHDWASSPIGTPDTWPQSLRISVSTVLNSAFPMLLFWGDDMLCFYNDAFRPSLGVEGRHPGIGKRGQDLWEDVWAFAGPLLEEVMATGKPVYFENQLIPFYRDGKIEDIYWTFSYSAVYNEEGHVAGVLAICNETTELVVANRKLRESEDRFRAVINAAPFPLGIYTGKEMKVSYVNQSIIDTWGKGPDVVGKTFVEVLPELKEGAFPDQLDSVYTSGKPFSARNQQVDLVMNGELTKFYFHYDYTPLFDTDGNVYGVMNTAVDVTDLVTAQEKLQESEQRVRSLILASRFPMAVYIGREMRIETANQPIIDIWGKGSNVIGDTYYNLLPELESQNVYPLLDGVFTSGKPFHAYNQRIELLVDGQDREFYFDYSFIPLFDTEGNVYGVLNTAADVTDLNIAKRQVEESEQNMRNMIMQAPVAMCILMGDDHKIEVANDLMIELWGKPKESVMGKPVFDALPDAREQGLEALMEMVYRKGETFKASEMPVSLLRNGQQEDVYQNFVYEPYYDGDKNIIGVLAVTIDVTAQVMARRKIEESETRIRSIIDSAPFPIGVYTGSEKTIAFANQSILDVWGKGNDVIGKTYTEILPELVDQQIFEQVTGVYETGIPFHARNQRVDIVVDNKLQPFWFNYSFTPVLDAEGNIYGVMNTAAEVTDLNLAKLKIEESEKSFRNMILQSPVASCIYRGEEYVIEIANNAMFEFWGVEPETVLGKPLFEAMPNVRDQGFEAILSGVRTTGIPFVAKEMVATLKRDGKPTDVYINFSLEPIKEGDSTISGILAIAIDVNEQVQARREIEKIVSERTEELAKANESLQRSNAELEQFAYIASHDLQEPLRKVTTFTQLLEMSLKDIPEHAHNYLEKINSSTERMTGLIRDVLHYSQLSRDEGNAYQPVDLNSVIDLIVTDYELLIAQKNARIIYKDLPVIEALPRQMSQLLSNLVSNALKFSREGQPAEITIGAEKLSGEELAATSLPAANAPYYKIEVRDNGIGFEQEHAQKIFNIFQRLHGKTEYSGTGIGLAMCKKIAVNHKGDIYARSTPGEGSVFTLILPEKQ